MGEKIPSDDHRLNFSALSPSVEINDSVVFITGANRKRGIGRVLVHEAVKRGAKKVYASARDVSQVQDLANLYPGRVAPISLDVTDSKQVERVSQEAADTQILINNAGMAGYRGFCFGYDEVVARQEMEVNYFGPLNMIRAFSQNMIERNEGVCVNIVSIVGMSPIPLAGTYSASKAAAHSLTISTRAELRPHGISVFAVYPGPIDTDMAEGVDLEKETPENTAIRIFDGIAQGVEDITPDAFSANAFKELRENPKAVEKEFAALVHTVAGV